MAKKAKKIEKAKANVYVLKQLIKEESISELDFVLHDRFGFDYEKQKDFEVITPKRSEYTDATEIEIDILIKKLQNYQKKGATHVEIEHHSDHHGYDISAWKMTLAPKKEIDEFEAKKEEKRKKNEEINNLRNQIRKLETQD